MPIRFRCTYCNRLLGIATRKAGTDTTCPHCGHTITVPHPAEDENKTERLNLDDVEQLLGGPTERMAAAPATQVIAAPSPPPYGPQARGAGPGTDGGPPPYDPQERAADDPRAEERPRPPAKPLISKPTAPPPLPKPPAPPRDPDDPPLFENDIDAIFGASVAKEPERPKPPPVSGMDAMSLGAPPAVIVLSAQKATLLMGGVVILLALSFAAGYFLAK